MNYRPPTDELIFMMRHVGGLDTDVARTEAESFSLDLLKDIFDQATRFAVDVIAPLNLPGDRTGVSFADGTVTTPPGWKEAYDAWIASGWNGIAAQVRDGGAGLPMAVGAGCIELWASAALSFSLCGTLTMGGLDALSAHGSEDLKKRYISKVVNGDWRVI